MKAVLFVLFFILCTSPCHAEGLKFLFEAKPLGILIAPHAEDFEATRISDPSESEEIETRGNYFATMKMGGGFDTRAVSLDLTGGGGYFRNEAFTVTYGIIDFMPRFKAGPRVTFGPHFGFLFFDSPDWDGSAQLDIEGSDGFMSGFEMTFGQKVAFSLAFDYIDTTFDVKPQAGSDWQVNRNKINMSGMSVQIGIVGHF